MCAKNTNIYTWREQAIIREIATHDLYDCCLLPQCRVKLCALAARVLDRNRTVQTVSCFLSQPLHRRYSQLLSKSTPLRWRYEQLLYKATSALLSTGTNGCLINQVLALDSGGTKTNSVSCIPNQCCHLDFSKINKTSLKNRPE